MSEPVASAPEISGRTAWVRGLETPLRSFLRTESGSAAVLLAASLAALVVITTVYSGAIAIQPLAIALLFFGALLVVRAARVRYGLVYAALGVAAWVACCCCTTHGPAP